MAIRDPKARLTQITDKAEQRTLLSLMSIIEGVFGFDYVVANGKVIEVRMVATGLVSVPRQFAELPHLYKLQLTANKIKKLRNISGCKSLQILTLSNNLIGNDDLAPLSQLPDLKVIDLSYNQIQSLSPLCDLSKLETLNLADNQISDIPPMPKLNKLKILDLSGNPIKKIQNIHYLESLSQVKISGDLLNAEEKRVMGRDVSSIKEYCRHLKLK